MIHEKSDSNKCSVIIPASGFSTRMGECKFMLTYKDGITFLENIISCFDQDFIDKIVIVVQKDSIDWISQKINSGKLTLIQNDTPQLERFYSIQLGLVECKNDDFIFIHNSDMPFINPEIIQRLYDNRSSTAYVSPVFKGKNGHPVLINKNIASEILKSPVTSDLRNVLASFDRIQVNVENEGILIDIDTPEKYEQYCSMA